MSKNYLSFIIVGFIIVVVGLIFWGYSSDKKGNSEISTGNKCEVDEMIFYYLDTCSWCQKVKSEGTISKIEELGVKVKQVNTKTGVVRHKFQGVPTFVINEEIYSGYKTFEELRELLDCAEETSNPVSIPDFIGEKGDEISLANGQLELNSEMFDDNLAHYYHTTIPSGKTIYFFVIKDKAGVYRAAANACQVCFDARMGFRQEGDFMVCNTCGNKYPLKKIATEKGGCNPGPINPNLEIRDGKIFIKQSDLEQVSNFF